MIDARRLTPFLRYFALVGVAATFIGGTAVFALNQTQTGIETRQVAKVVPVRPSYLAPLPKLTAKDFDVARSVPAVVTGREPAITAAAPEVQVASIEPETGVSAPLTVTVDAANIRSGPSKSTDKAFVLRRGAVVEVLATRDGWTQVRGRDGQTGWIWTEFLNR